MARIYLSPIASGSAKLHAPLHARLFIRSDFDWEVTWSAACRRDDEDGEREAAEDPDELRSNPDEDPVDLLGFSSDSDADMLDEDASDAESATSTPTTTTTRTLSPRVPMQSIVTPSPCPALPREGAPSTTRSDDTPKAGKKRKRGAGAKASNRKRKDRKKVEDWEERKREELPPFHGKAYVRRYLHPDVVHHDFDVLHLKAVKGGDTGINKKRTSGEKTVPQTLEEADARGYGYYPWDGMRTVHLLEKNSKIAGVCVGRANDNDGRPDDQTWKAATERLAKHLDDTRDKYDHTFTKADRKNRRGDYIAVNVGITRGSGSKRVHTLSHKKDHVPMVKELLEHPDTKRIVGFQNEALAAHYPRVYGRLKDTIDTIQENQPDIRLNFPTYSIYPGCAFNMGPSTVTDDHTDPGNNPVLPCGVTSLGPYDPDKGGFLVLEDFKLVIRFPPGSTILFSSASIRHANIPVQKGEKRFSVTQFCPGGLFRWVRHGCRPACTLSKAERQELDGDPDVRWRELWDLLSTPKSLQADREWLVRKEAIWLENRKARRFLAAP